VTLIPSVNDFLASYPEFAGASTIAIKLSEAAARTNARVYQSAALAAQAVMLRAAILLIKSPDGRAMRLENPDLVSVWDRELKQLQRSATMGLRVF
jgi:hypothetical protein